MKSSETANYHQTEAQFISDGMKAIEVEFAKPRDSLASMICTPTDVYTGLLKSAFWKRPLFTGKKDGNNRPIKYDPAKRLLFSKEDGRILVPMKLVSDMISRAPDNGPTSNFGAEMTRQIRNGNGEAQMFEYNEQGEYIGVKVNRKLMSSEELMKPHDNGLCATCQSKAKNKCSGCHSVNYCNVQCQRADWPSRKAVCQYISKVNK